MDGQKRPVGRPNIGRADTERLIVYLAPNIAALTRKRAKTKKLSITGYIEALIRSDLELECAGSKSRYCAKK